MSALNELEFFITFKDIVDKNKRAAVTLLKGRPLDTFLLLYRYFGMDNDDPNLSNESHDSEVKKILIEDKFRRRRLRF